MQFSLTPLLIIIELSFVLMLAIRLRTQTGQRCPSWSVLYFVLWLAIYAIGTSVLGAKGMYLRPEVLRLLPGFWLQLITVAAAFLPVVAFKGLRSDLRLIVDQTPLHWFAWFHALRIAALGTAYKTAIGEFPVYFELWVGVPDLLFGISAVWMAYRLRNQAISITGFMIWNLIGALIIVPSAPILLQLGLPGPLYVFTALPDARTVFTYPMSIAPMIGVPMFVLINLWVAWCLAERRYRNLPPRRHAVGE